MLNSAFLIRNQVRLSNIFEKAGTIDKIVTRVQILLSQSKRREEVLDNFHKRWESRVLAELDDGGREIELQSGRTGVVEKRREAAREKLEFARTHKENLLHFRI